MCGLSSQGEGPCIEPWPPLGMDGFVQVNFTLPITTEYLLITTLKKCNTEDGWMGLREVRLMGRLVME